MKTMTSPSLGTPVNPYKVGDGATLCGYSDRYAYTVIKVTKTKITLQRDKAVLLNGVKSGEEDALTFTPGGLFGHTEGIQRYSYESDPNGQIAIATMRKKLQKRSLPCGKWTKDESGNLVTHEMVTAFVSGIYKVIEGRHEHYDFNF